MCGIAGQYQWGGTQASFAEMERVGIRQAKRGPDGNGIYHLDVLTLGHRRLKIFDLTDKAAQPMVDHQLGLAVVFNGAIYNFHDLRTELQAKGYHFISDSDTEVLLKAYHAWGGDCVPRLRGMFAFAIWERETGKLVLARDRMGIKPLYYAKSAEGFKFASTLPALLQFEGVDTSIDKAALQYYLTFHAVPDPLTLLSGVKKLPPACVMTVHADGRIEEKPYWQLRFNESSADHTRSEAAWLEATQAALTKATSRQLEADVPVGVLLSGGLDSSLLVALAASIRGQRIETFSIGFESASGERGDEFVYSDLVAKHFATKHHQMFISNRRLADALGDCVAAMSEPMISHDNIGFYLLAQEVAQYVKVALSGQGADELFAGYSWFHTLPSQSLSARKSAELIHKTVADRSYAAYEALVSEDYRQEDISLPFLEALCVQNGSSNAVDNMMAYESGFALANGPLCRVDSMTMAASLEARVPFLDEVVVDLALEAPLSCKMPEGGKYVLKQLGRLLLPKEVVDRPKGYFPVPALKYLHGDTLDLMQDVLSPQRVRERGLFDSASVADMLAYPARHLNPTGGSQLWQIGLLEYWLQQQGI